ncbi:MAG TPA: hypothetical protein VM925_26810, partial [Labilithrix sp.]|nr:hypothetical protein [Labilithrix sp.]
PTTTVAAVATVVPAPPLPPRIDVPPVQSIEAVPSAPPRLARPAPSARQVGDAGPPPSPSARGLAAERALLDVARSALARGEASEALRAAERHASEYPNGALVEEREAIAIKALVALSRRDEARVRAAAMERRFPNGLMLHAVKNAVGEAP